MGYLALYALYALSLLWSINPEYAGSQLETKFGLLLIPLLVYTNKTGFKRSQFDSLLNTFVYANLAVFFLAIARALWRAWESGSATFISAQGNAVSYFTYIELSDPFMHPGYLATHFGLAFLILLFRLIEGKGDKGADTIMILVLLTAMVLVQGRINMLALLLVLLSYGLIKAIQLRKIWWLVLPIIPAGILIVIFLWAPNNIGKRYLQFPDFSYDIKGEEFNSATYRLAEWTCAWDAIQERPLVGAGIGGNNKALWRAYEERGFLRGLEARFNAHNQFLETWITIGAIGLFCLLALFAFQFKEAIRARDELYIFSLLFFVICLFTESMFERAWAVILFSSFFPLLSLRLAIKTP
jgi:O-antigen ligase